MKVVYALTVSLLLLLVGWFYLSSGIVSYSSMEQTQVSVENADIEFGDIQQNKPKQAIFNLKNTGSSPLLIQNVETSCGCTVPEWTKKPVKPGEYGEIKVTYDAKYPGRFHKTITVFANVGDSQILLSISGEVGFSEQ